MNSEMKCAKCGLLNGDLRYQVLFVSGAMGFVCKSCFDSAHPENKRQIA